MKKEKTDHQNSVELVLQEEYSQSDDLEYHETNLGDHSPPLAENQRQNDEHLTFIINRLFHRDFFCPDASMRHLDPVMQEKV